MKIVFMGSPEFASRIMEELCKKHEIAALVTGMDVRKNRGKKIEFPVCKKKAIELGIDVYQYDKLDDDFRDMLVKIKPDLVVLAAYGKIIPEYAFSLVKGGFLNIHPSILPKYRGASPIQSAILNGDNETGVALMNMNKNLDEGDIYSIKKIKIEDMNFTELSEKLIDLSISMLDDFLIDVPNQDKAKKQQGETCYAAKINKKQYEINWIDGAEKAYRKIKAFGRVPGAYTYWRGKRLKIIEADFIESKNKKNENYAIVHKVDKDSLQFLAKDGIINVKELQIVGSKVMPIAEFLRGRTFELGEKIGI